MIEAAGLFQPAAVSQLVEKVTSGKRLGETDDMALAGILSTQLVYQQFVTGFQMPLPLSQFDDVKICIRNNPSRRSGMEFSKDVLKIDPAAETERIVELLQQNVHQVLRRYGAVVGISGGVDSSTVFALCVRAFGPEKVSCSDDAGNGL